MFGNDDGDGVDAFAIPDLWKLSSLTIEPEDPVTRPLDQFGFGEIDGKNPILFPAPNQINLRLPILEHFNFGTLEVISAPESVAASDLDIPRISEEEQQHDGFEEQWILAGRDEPGTRVPVARSWERFYNHDFVEPTKYLSEAGSRAFDAALRPHDIGKALDESKVLVISQQPLLRALFLLGLGQESVLFRHNTPYNTFSFRHKDLSISGLSTQLTNSLAKSFASTGSRFRLLQTFVDQSYDSPNSSSTRVAVAETVSALLMALNRHLVKVSTSAHTLLQVQSIFRQPVLILDYLFRLVCKIQLSEKEHANLSETYRFAEDCEYRDAWARPLTLQILARVSAPWLDSLNACLGLRSSCVDQDLQGRILRCAEQYVDGEEIDLATAMPSFVAGRELATVLQTCYSLEVLKAHHRNHILIDKDTMNGMDPPSLEWHFSWSDIKKIQDKAKDYENRVLQALGVAKAERIFTPRSYAEPRTDEHSLNPYGSTEANVKAQLSHSSNFIQQPPTTLDLFDCDPLHQSLQKVLSLVPQEERTTFAPPLSLAPLMSFWPIISSQARLVNQACLQMLFKEHKLSSHFRLQRQFHLFGDGVFATRLSQALFDPSLETAERRKGHSRAGKMGLRLGSRSTWPPASSELRLVLMGILTETYHGSSSSSSSSEGLPGSLSFAIRDLSEPEIQRCLNPRGLEALDFLRLRYNPPAPLDVIITPNSLEKYDSIFKFLLRIQRLLTLTGQRARSTLLQRSHTRGTPHSPSENALATRIRFETRHFVTAVADYFLGAGVGGPWDRFFAHVESLEANLDDPSCSTLEAGLGVGGAIDGLHGLRALHDKMLDEVLFALLLRRRQAPVMALLEEIFGLVLRLTTDDDANEDGTVDGDGDGGGGTKEAELYAQFRKKVGVFLAVCKGLGERAHGYSAASGPESGSGIRREAGAESTLEQLVLRLEMNGWYAQKGS